jgi:hypothetical protein
LSAFLKNKIDLQEDFPTSFANLADESKLNCRQGVGVEQDTEIVSDGKRSLSIINVH